MLDRYVMQREIREGMKETLLEAKVEWMKIFSHGTLKFTID